MRSIKAVILCCVHGNQLRSNLLQCFAILRITLNKTQLKSFQTHGNIYHGCLKFCCWSCSNNHNIIKCLHLKAFSKLHFPLLLLPRSVQLEMGELTNAHQQSTVNGGRIRLHYSKMVKLFIISSPHPECCIMYSAATICHNFQILQSISDRCIDIAKRSQ